jgi:phage shock protein C
MTSNHRDRDGHRLYRDSENGWVLGVCAGLAQSFGLPIWLVRVGMAGLLFVLTWWHVVLAYLVLAVFLSDRPLRYCGRGDEKSFWSRHTHRHSAYRR